MIPVATAVTIPELLTVAMAEEELQVPPPVGSVRGMVKPIQTLDGPDIADGDAMTVTVFVAVQVPRE